LGRPRELARRLRHSPAYRRRGLARQPERAPPAEAGKAARSPAGDQSRRVNAGSWRAT